MYTFIEKFEVIDPIEPVRGEILIGECGPVIPYYILSGPRDNDPRFNVKSTINAKIIGY